MRWGNDPYSCTLHTTYHLQLFPTHYWVITSMVIADTCEYHKLFPTTPVCRAPMASESWFVPWWFPPLTSCWVGSCCEPGLALSWCMDTLQRTLQLLRRAWSLLAWALLREEFSFQQESRPPSHSLDIALGSSEMTALHNPDPLGRRMVQNSFWWNCKLRFTLLIFELRTGPFKAAAPLCECFGTNGFAFWGFSH